MTSLARVVFLLVITTSLLLSSCAPGTGSHGLKAWFVDSLVKVFPDDAVGANGLPSGDFMAGRNQHANIQVALRSVRAFSTLTARLEPLKDSSGHTIDVSNATLRQVGYVVVGSHTPKSPADELVGTAPGWYPDPLFALPLDIEANRTYSIWVEIHVPRDTYPGDYQGAIDIRAAQTALAHLSFRLRVETATVPEERTLNVTNWFTLDDQRTQQFFGVPAFSDRWWKLVGNVARVFAAHRQKVVITPLMILVQPKLAGRRLRYDFSNFDRWVETFQSAGAMKYIEGSHLLTRPYYTAPLGVEVFERKGKDVVTDTLPPDSPEVRRFLASFLTALNKHLEARAGRSARG